MSNEGAAGDKAPPTYEQLLEAVLRDDDDGDLSELLRVHDIDIDMRQKETGRTLLYNAARSGKCRAMEVLLSHEATVDAPDKDGFTPLATAAGNQSGLDDGKSSIKYPPAAALKLLLEHGAAIDGTSTFRAGPGNKKGLQPAHMNIINNATHEALEALLDAGANVDAASDDGMSLAHIAAKAGRPAALGVLIRRGACLDAKTNKETPLQLARKNNEAHCAALLALASLDDKLIASPPELGALAGSSIMATALSRAWASDPLLTICMAIRLHKAYQDQAHLVIQLDYNRGEEMLEASEMVQHMTIAMLPSLDSGFVASSIVGHSSPVLIAALRAEAKTLLATPILQRKIYDAWRLVGPMEVHQYVKRQWWRQKETRLVAAKYDGELVKPIEIRAKLGLLAIVARFSYALLHNAVLVIAVAAYPPLQAKLETVVQNRCALANDRVIARNTPISDTDAQGQKRDVPLFVDGVQCAHLSGHGEAKREEAKKKPWLARLHLVAAEEAQMELFWFPLLRPYVKFAVNMVETLALVVCLTFLRSFEQEEPGWLVTLLVWSVQMAVTEVAMAWDAWDLWCADPLNFMLLAGHVLGAGALALGLTVRLDVDEAGAISTLTNSTTNGSALIAMDLGAGAGAGERGSGGWQDPATPLAILAFAVLCTITAQSLRLFQRSPTYGPLLISAFLMVREVAGFLTLAVGPLIGFTAGFFVLFKGAPSLGDDCEPLHEAGWTNARSLSSAGVFLFETIIDGDSGLRCLHDSPEMVYSIAGPLLMQLYLITFVLLFLNQLIAQVSMSVSMPVPMPPSLTIFFFCHCLYSHALCLITSGTADDVGLRPGPRATKGEFHVPDSAAHRDVSAPVARPESGAAPRVSLLPRQAAVLPNPAGEEVPACSQSRGG